MVLSRKSLRRFLLIQEMPCWCSLDCSNFLRQHEGWYHPWPESKVKDFNLFKSTRLAVLLHPIVIALRIQSLHQIVMIFHLSRKLAKFHSKSQAKQEEYTPADTHTYKQTTPSIVLSASTSDLTFFDIIITTIQILRTSMSDQLVCVFVCVCLSVCACVYLYVSPLSQGPICNRGVCYGLLCWPLMQRGPRWKWTEPTLGLSTWCLPWSLCMPQSPSIPLVCVGVCMCVCMRACVCVPSSYQPDNKGSASHTHTWKTLKLVGRILPDNIFLVYMLQKQLS